ncbi:carbohydrate-binding protein [Purpureocillium lavendulum]|uniref:Carbohydrate-binding protein n=1 Tax=Purpureocillium lavendulum TaxID=1247861 RepID=A0AB34G4A0_9HYPO|nr:carbohydrate-binding protein [Purpureocillium lavendulum]
MKAPEALIGTPVPSDMFGSLIPVVKPTVVSWDSKRTDIFVLGPENTVMYKCHVPGPEETSQWYPQDNTFSDLGGYLASNISAVSRAYDVIDLFGISPSGDSIHAWWNGNQWSEWESFSGNFIGDLSVVSWGSRRMDVFARGKDNAAYHRYWTGRAWSEWAYLGGIMATNPLAVSRRKDSINVFFIGADKHLYHKAWDGFYWSPQGYLWEDLGEYKIGPFEDITAVAAGPDEVILFTRCADSSVSYKTLVSREWCQWRSLGGRSLSQIAAAVWSDGTLTVAVRGFDNQPWVKTRRGESWSNWTPVEGLWLGDGPVIQLRGPADPIFIARGPHFFQRGRHTGLYAFY